MTSHFPPPFPLLVACLDEARLLKFLILFVASVAILHKLQPYGLALF
jgi:hypothetical protein